MRFSSFIPLIALPFVWAANIDASRQKLIDLAIAGNGDIRVDPKTFELLTSPDRNWTASIQFTALDKRRRCAPCRCAILRISHVLNNIWNREFEPAWNAVAKSWATTPKQHRYDHFFATLDFDEAPNVFQQVRSRVLSQTYPYSSIGVAGPYLCSCCVRISCR